MNTFFDTRDLLDAAGISLPPGSPNTADVARKISNDGLVQKRAMALAVESFVIEALRQLSGPERDMLHKRAGVAQPDYAHQADWAVKQTEISGLLYIRVQCPRCNQDGNFRAPESWVERKMDQSGSTLDIPHPVTREIIRAMLDRVSFAHCGRLEKLPADTRQLAEQAFMALVQS